MKLNIKYISTISLLWILSMIAKADDNSKSAMLFEQFEDGYVITKSSNSAAKVQAKLNYNVFTEKVIFIEDSIAYELDPQTVIAAFINNRMFIPVGNSFYYERVTVGNNEYFIRHKSKIISKGKNAGYGTYSESSAIVSASSLSALDGFVGNSASSEQNSFAGQDYTFNTSDHVYRKDETVLYVTSGKKYIPITSLKRLRKVFKSHQSAITSFAENAKTDFSKLEDVRAIVEYAFSL
ncbi:hypothetical protein M2137_000427 [Parabacteroides sp. PFB2-10]|uniref:hypothetical protein n=1 Tax=Parabacteroides sp. PFB2-10 TaxID=1742405 RepID=UPI0024759402|nr:hypothetical protein [Parabacteroides sp. PFB2-10]MDH6311668.1 hypothetical protein [Parabacteroides sp. PFB2-10]